MELKEYVFNNYLKNLIHSENGIKYISEQDLDGLKLDSNERLFVLNILQNEKIIIKKEMITQKDRPKLVRDYNYGDMQSNDLTSRDETVKSVIEFNQDNNVVYENYEELEMFLDSEFIPKYVRMKKRKDQKTGDIVYVPSIQLNHIVDLKLSELEVKHVFKYLNDLNIRIGGTSPDIDSDLEIENYDYVRTYKESEKPKYDSTLNDEQRIHLYQQTKDISLRKLIIENNIRLASYVAYKFSVLTGINIHEIESYAFEGLINAVEGFDINKGYKFSTFAYPCIKNCILNGIPKIEGFYLSNFYNGYIVCKKTVEEVRGETLEENPNLLEDVYNLMKQTGKTTMKYKDFKALVYISQPILFEDMDTIASDYNLEDEFTEKITNEEFYDFISFLSPREKYILERRYGLKDDITRTLDEIGKELGISGSRVGEIEAKALRKIRTKKHIMDRKKDKKRMGQGKFY